MSLTGGDSQQVLRGVCEPHGHHLLASLVDLVPQVILPWLRTGDHDGIHTPYLRENGRTNGETNGETKGKRKGERKGD